MLDKNKALSDYIATYPQLYGWLFFNTIQSSVGETSLMTDSINVLDNYIDNTKRKEYLFAIMMMKPYDTGTSDNNIDVLAETQNFIKWIDEQDELKNYPDWVNCLIKEISVLSEMPILSVDQDTNVAQYMIQLRIEYVE